LFLIVIWNAAGQAAGCRRQNEKEKSKTSPNLRVGLPQFSRLGSLREQYFKRLNLVSRRRQSDFRCVAIRSAGYGELDAISNAVDYAKFRSRSHNALICVCHAAGNVIETHVRPLESIAETQPQLQPASLGLSAMISHYFMGCRKHSYRLTDWKTTFRNRLSNSPDCM
jgi:hypothetical protein